MCCLFCQLITSYLFISRCVLCYYCILTFWQWSGPEWSNILQWIKMPLFLLLGEFWEFFPFFFFINETLVVSKSWWVSTLWGVGSTLLKVYSKPLRRIASRLPRDRSMAQTHSCWRGTQCASCLYPTECTRTGFFTTISQNEKTSDPNIWLLDHVTGVAVCAVHHGHGLLENHPVRRTRRLLHHQSGLVLVQPVERLFHRLHSRHQLQGLPCALVCYT